MLSKVLLSLLISTSAGTLFAQENGRSIAVDTQLQTALASCQINLLTDKIACPIAMKLAFQSARSLRDYLRSGPYRVTRENHNRSYRMLRENIEEYLELDEHIDALDPADRPAAMAEADSLRSVLHPLQIYLGQQEARGLELYTAADTQWNSGEDAKGVLIVNRADKTVTIILHGGVEGPTE